MPPAASISPRFGHFFGFARSVVSPALRLDRTSGPTRRPRGVAASPRQSVRRNPVFSCGARGRHGALGTPRLPPVSRGGETPISLVAGFAAGAPASKAWLERAAFLEEFSRKLSRGLFFVRTAQLDLPPGENGGSLGTGLSLAHDQSVVTSVTLSQATRCVLLMCRLTSCSRVSHEAATLIAVSLTTVILLLTSAVVFERATASFRLLLGRLIGQL